MLSPKFYMINFLFIQDTDIADPVLFFKITPRVDVPPILSGVNYSILLMHKRFPTELFYFSLPFLDILVL